MPCCKINYDKELAQMKSQWTFLAGAEAVEVEVFLIRWQSLSYQKCFLMNSLFPGQQKMQKKS